MAFSTSVRVARAIPHNLRKSLSPGSAWKRRRYLVTVLEQSNGVLRFYKRDLDDCGWFGVLSHSGRFPTKYSGTCMITLTSWLSPLCIQASRTTAITDLPIPTNAAQHHLTRLSARMSDYGCLVRDSRFTILNRWLTSHPWWTERIVRSVAASPRITVTPTYLYTVVTATVPSARICTPHLPIRRICTGYIECQPLCDFR